MNTISSLPGSVLQRWAKFLVPFLLPVLALVVSACTTYSHTHSYQTRGYAYQQSAGYYYSPSYVYYGSYQPGWSVSMGFGGGYYGGGFYGSWSYGSPYGWSVPYWPTYAVPYYQPRYRYAYGYYDPWYYSWSGYHGGYHGYGYGSPYWPGNRYGYGYGSGYSNPYGGGHYGGKPYYGGSHTYRPPGHQQPGYQHPNYQDGQRPDPVVIPREQRGRRDWDRDNGYYPRDYQGNAGGNAGQRPQPQNARPAELRSTTVVTEQQGMSRSVSVAPGSSGEEGMVVSNRGEQKVRQSRMHPSSAQPASAQPNVAPTTGVPVRRQPDRQQYARAVEASSQGQQPSQSAQQSYQHTVNASNVNGRAQGHADSRGQVRDNSHADSRESRDSDREQDR